jgi:transposase
MAYREYGMWEILDVLRRFHRRESKSAIKRVTGRTRKTIRRYLSVACELGWSWEDEPTEELACQVLARLRPGAGADVRGASEEVLLQHQERIAEWLSGRPGERGLKLTKVHELLGRLDVHVPYSSLHRFAVKHCQFGGARLTVCMPEVEPGELVEVDFGRLGYLFDPERARRRLVHALIVTLVHSRHQYVHLTHTQKLPNLIDGLEAAWEFFGGCVRRVVIDNMKTAVVKSDRYEPVFQRTFAEYADYRGFVIDAARRAQATDKPHVERAVAYVRESFFRGESFLSLAHAQQEAIRWCLSKAGTRIHGTTKKVPLRVFEQVEQACLRPLDKPRFDTPSWAHCGVHPDHTVRFGQARYTVPTPYIGRQVDVRGDSKLVRIYFRGELIKTHPRKPPGGRSIDYHDYPPEKSAYAMRDPNRMCRLAQAFGDNVRAFMSRLLEGDFPWAKLRQAQMLLRLADKFGSVRIDSACRRALAFDLINVYGVKRILEQGLDTQQIPRAGSPQILLFPTRFLRPSGSFTHGLSTRKENTDGD